MLKHDLVLLVLGIELCRPSVGKMPVQASAMLAAKKASFLACKSEPLSQNKKSQTLRSSENVV